MSSFIALRTDGKLQWQGLTAALTAGHRYHVACQSGPSGSAIYLTDITASGSGTLVASNSTALTALPSAQDYGIRVLNPSTGALTQAGATIDEITLWDYLRYSGSTYTAPTAPFTGMEPGIAALYHLDSNCAESVVN